MRNLIQKYATCIFQTFLFFFGSSVILVENPLSSELVLSDFDQSNLRRMYDGKCRYCPRVWFEFPGEMPDCQDMPYVNSDADEALA